MDRQANQYNKQLDNRKGNNAIDKIHKRNNAVNDN